MSIERIRIFGSLALMFCLYPCGLAIHLWTILISYHAAGFIDALVTMVIPIGSEIYWAVRVTLRNGPTLYLEAIVAYVALYFLMIVLRPNEETVVS